MIQLDYHNLLLQNILTEQFEGEGTNALDQTIADFDGVTFHISSNPDSRHLILISLSIKCYKELVKYGADEVLKREYSQYIVAAEQGYDFSIQIDTNNLPNDEEERKKLIDKVALLKRNAMAAPFERAFAKYDELAEKAEKAPHGVPQDSLANEIMAVHYRAEEAIYINPSYDRVTVIFSTVFREETDRVFGKVFLQEFVDARKRAIQNAPQVLYSAREPPLEIRNIPGLSRSNDIGYVTFVLFPRHVTPERRNDCISQIQIFRDYFHFHIKCSKAYMHSRMRHRVSEFIKILNRSKPENADKEKKTVTGRTFIASKRL